VKLNGMTGQPDFVYNSEPNSYLSNYGVHTDGTIFAVQYNSDTRVRSVFGIDPLTGVQKFSIPIVSNGVLAPLIVAGDGYAYVAYVYYEGSNSSVGHLMLLRTDTTGTYNTIHVIDSQDANGIAVEPYMITNADQGVLLTWTVYYSEGVFDGMALITQAPL
jgi:hypothetical protein